MTTETNKKLPRHIEDQIKAAIPMVHSSYLEHHSKNRCDLRIEYAGEGAFWPVYVIYAPHSHYPFAMGCLIDDMSFHYGLIDEKTKHFIQLDTKVKDNDN